LAWSSGERRAGGKRCCSRLAKPARPVPWYRHQDAGSHPPDQECSACVILATVGELPEAPEHAQEECLALRRQIAEAAHYFGDTVVGTAMELGGDPVHGILALAAEHEADVTVLPELSSRQALAMALQARTLVEVRRLGIPVGTAAPSGHTAEPATSGRSA
jgi:hypothetical protein